MAQSLHKVSLEDKYTLIKGRIFVSGSQALVRLPMLQRDMDLANGLNTAGFVSGYRGSPLAGLDKQLSYASKYLENHQIKFTPGINEDLGATAVWGTQQTTLFPGAKYDGVFGMWYGKGPGVDRSMDVFKHANAAGTSQYGGVLALMGDDHDCVSSTLGHQSEQDMIAAMVPVLYPSTVQEFIDFGLIGWGMSRYAGCWVSMKCATEVVESSASIETSPDRIKLQTPTDHSIPEGGLSIRMPDPPLAQEMRLQDKANAAIAYARANKVDQTIIDSKKARLGIITSGKSYKDVLQAFDDLGISHKKAEKLGIRVYKVGLVWPIEPQGALEFAEGLEEILVVEEKREMIEQQLKSLMFNLPANQKPIVVGKYDETGEQLLPFAGGHTPRMVAEVIAKRIEKMFNDTDIKKNAAYIETLKQQQISYEDKVVRLPYYCAGCPHNISTKVIEGSRAIAGIGCHYMVQWMNRSSNIITHMGGEGVNWVGHAPFTSEPHVFANLGDGTYYHSGSLAVRQAVASGVNITYKILYNDVIAMTGGQTVEGPLSVQRVSQQMAAEGVSKIYVMSDEPEKYTSKSEFAAGTIIKHRDSLEDVQKDLRDTKGTSILIYDQTCAAEKRRRRKRGKYPDPAKRAFINPLVCEGCGDCSEKSNCVAVEPLETEFGRKRQINQSSCNKDYSCTNGFCPSFVTVEGGTLKKGEKQDSSSQKFTQIPEPKIPNISGSYNMLITGIGGTGVITIGAILGMAAHIDGKGVTILDQTGLAQKNGAVMSHLRIAENPEDLHAVRIAIGNADLVLGCDMVVSGNSKALSRMSAKRTTAIINSHMTPTANFTLDPDTNFHETETMAKIAGAIGKDSSTFIEATHLATTLMGDAIATNMFMLGYAWQQGLIPVSHKSIIEALTLNGVAVESNISSFNWGRLAAHDPNQVKQIVHKANNIEEDSISETLEDLISKRITYLTGYQDASYASKYQELVEKVAKAEQKAIDGSTMLTEAVARYAFKLMSYKDEYEVARLYTSGEFEQRLKDTFTGDYKLKFHLAPPLLSKKNSKGELQKMEFNSWMLPAFRVLAKLKGLRGTPLDIFNYTAERKTERKLLTDYIKLISEICTALNNKNHTLAVALARIPEEIRGFGHVKERHIELALQKQHTLLEAFKNPDKIEKLGEVHLPGAHLPNSKTKQKIKIAIS